MLDIKLLRDDIDGVIAKLNTRGGDFSHLNKVITLDDERREIIKVVEEKKAFRNTKSKEIGKVKAEGGDVSPILSEVESIGDEIKSYDEKLNILDQEIREILLSTPNVPRETIPVGVDEEQNVEVSK